MSKKSKSIISVLLLGLSITLSVSCVSRTPKDRGEEFLGDFDPIQLENLMALTYNAVSGLKPVEIRSYLVPRTNTVELYFRDFANEIALVLDKKTRDQFLSAAEEYLALYEKNLLVVKKPTKKDAFANGRMSLGWGVLNPARYTIATYWVNYKFIEDKPYFMLYLNPSPEIDSSSAYSPMVELYFSPAQIRAFLEVTDQANLETIVSEYNLKAYTFE